MTLHVPAASPAPPPGRSKQATSPVLSLIVAVLLCGVSVSSIQAEPIVVSSTGTLYDACGPRLQSLFGFSATAGDPFTFSIHFNTGAPDMAALDPSLGLYSFGAASITASLGTETVTLPVLSVSGTVTNAPTGGSDSLAIFASTAFRSVGLTFQGYDPFGQTSSWLSTDAWPTDVATVLNGAPQTVALL
jgi:hypothetical protein